MNNIIKNLKPDLYQNLLVDLVSSNIENNKSEIEKYLRSKLGITRKFTKHTSNYWKIRGWTDEESYIKSKENKQKNCKSVYSKEFWLEKINQLTGRHYTSDEADFERNSRRPIRKEYWIKKGYSGQEAELLAFDTKNQNNKKGSEKSSQTNLRRITSKRCLEYYTARGHSIEEAKTLVSNSQKFFSKDMCIQKYGEIEGIEVWKNRQKAWQQTLNSKSQEEKSRINRLKLSKGITVSKNETIIFEEIKKIDPTAIHQLTLSYSEKKQYIYDIAVGKKIIEYNGDFWHANPKIYSSDFINPRTNIKAIDKWALDENKIKFAIQQGYEVLIVWEKDFKNNKKDVIDQCIQFLQT